MIKRIGLVSVFLCIGIGLVALFQNCAKMENTELSSLENANAPALTMSDGSSVIKPDAVVNLINGDSIVADQSSAVSFDKLSDNCVDDESCAVSIEGELVITADLMVDYNLESLHLFAGNPGLTASLEAKLKDEEAYQPVINAQSLANGAYDNLSLERLKARHVRVTVRPSGSQASVKLREMVLSGSPVVADSSQDALPPNHPMYYANVDGAPAPQGQAGLKAATVLASDMWAVKTDTQAKNLGLTKYKIGITNAIKALPSTGGVVRVLPGEYTEMVDINKNNVVLVAMKNKTTRVNPTYNRNNADWPVTVKTTTGTVSAIYTSGPGQNITIEGFYVKGATNNGIHVGGNASNGVITRICENVYILGNKITNVKQDGIKANQCNRMWIQGNHITNFSTQTVGEHEHGIDFMAVANTRVIDNYISANNTRGIGMTVKGGSINVKLEKNYIANDYWLALSIGEAAGDPSTYPASYKSTPKYTSKYINITGNTLHGLKSADLGIIGCHSCSAISNTLKSNRISFGQKIVSGKVDRPLLSACYSGSGTPTVYFNDGVLKTSVKTSACTPSWTGGYKYAISTGSWDVKGGTGSFPPAP